VKSKTRTQITKTYLKISLRSATSRVNTDVDKLVKLDYGKFLTKDEHFYASKISMACRFTVLRVQFKFLGFECVLIFSLKLGHYILVLLLRSFSRNILVGISE